MSLPRRAERDLAFLMRRPDDAIIRFVHGGRVTMTGKTGDHRADKGNDAFKLPLNYY
jgi:hypothetical protein